MTVCINPPAPHNTKATTPIREGNTMKHRMTARLMGVALLAMPLTLLPGYTPASAQNVVRPAGELVLSIGRGQLVTIPGRMDNVFVANDKIADVEVKSTNQLYVFGKEAGETTVYASDARGNVIWSANVRVGNNIDSIDQMLGLAMPEAQIKVATMNKTVLLTGTVAAPEDAAEAERLVKAFVEKDINVVSRLKMATPLQVSLHVRFAEVSRSLVRDIGMNWASVDSTGGFKFTIGQGRPFYPQFTPGGPLGTGTNKVTGGSTITPGEVGTTLGGAGKFLGVDLLGALDLGEKAGLVTTLSEPNLTALSGETADFLAGGEYPIPISQGLGSTSIEYKKYGVSLAYTPTVLANGRISIRVRPEVSELSTQGAVQLNGFSIPALTIRRAETTVELGSGQSFMIAGLMTNGAQNSITKMPGAGDLPILGSLFRSTSFRRGDTELVIIVTPYLVNPVNANDIALPTDGYQSPDMVQQLLGNMLDDGKSGKQRPKPTERSGDAPQGAQVGALSQPTEQPGTKSQPDQRAKAEPVAPGFSLN